MKNYEEMTFNELYDYLEGNRDNLPQDEIFNIEILMEEIMRNNRRKEVEEKVWSKPLENKFEALYKAVCNDYNLENNYGYNFKDSLREAIRKAAENHYMYECSIS